MDSNLRNVFHNTQSAAEADGKTVTLIGGQIEIVLDENLQKKN